MPKVSHTHLYVTAPCTLFQQSFLIFNHIHQCMMLPIPSPFPTQTRLNMEVQHTYHPAQLFLNDLTQRHRLISSRSPSAYLQLHRQPVGIHQPVPRLPQEQVLVPEMESAERLHNAHNTIHTAVLTQKIVPAAKCIFDGFPQIQASHHKNLMPLSYQACIVFPYYKHFLQCVFQIQKDFSV